MEWRSDRRNGGLMDLEESEEVVAFRADVASWLEAFVGDASVFRTSSNKSFPRRYS